jgi:hypothetical protein
MSKISWHCPFKGSVCLPLFPPIPRYYVQPTFHVGFFAFLTGAEQRTVTDYLLQDNNNTIIYPRAFIQSKGNVSLTLTAELKL